MTSGFLRGGNGLGSLYFIGVLGSPEEETTLEITFLDQQIISDIKLGIV